MFESIVLPFIHLNSLTDNHFLYPDRNIPTQLNFLTLCCICVEMSKHCGIIVCVAIQYTLVVWQSIHIRCYGLLRERIENEKIDRISPTPNTKMMETKLIMLQ